MIVCAVKFIVDNNSQDLGASHIESVSRVIVSLYRIIVMILLQIGPPSRSDEHIPCVFIVRFFVADIFIRP